MKTSPCSRASERIRCLARGAQAVALQHDPSAKRFGSVDLDERRALRHDDRRRDPESPGMVGDPLGMITGGHRNDSGTPLARV